MKAKDMRILIVDDSPEDRVYVIRLLRRMAAVQWSIEEAETCAEALTRIRDQVFDCVLLDHSLPDGTGLEVLKKMASAAGELEVPVVYFTGARDEQLEVRAINAGAMDYIPKKALTEHHIQRTVLNAVERFQLFVENKRAEQAQRLTEQRLVKIAEFIPQILFTFKQDGKVEFLNDNFHRFTGSPLKVANGQTWKACLHADDLEAISAEWQAGIEKRVAFGVDYRLRRADGEYRWFTTWVSPVWSGTEIVEWVGAATEVHQLRAARDTLLKEVHHRVKNNLQVIASLLGLQSGKIKDPAARAALQESRRRVLSMSMVHDRLYGIRNLSEIDFGDYTQTLVSELLEAYTRAGQTIQCRFRLSAVFLSVDQAIPCALILNELVTNTLKYAYPEGSGEIWVELSESQGTVLLSVSDQGIGLQRALDGEQAGSKGMVIVKLLAAQLGGSLTVRPHGPTSFIVQFPKETVKSVPVA